MPPKRSAVSAGDDDDPSDKFTRFVKQKLQTYTRTGQACDRCKVRKIRCDGAPEGCTQCKSANTECRTTDRISRKAMPRGYVENLEERCREMEASLRRYEELHGPLPNTGPTTYGSVNTPTENGMRQNGLYENGVNGGIKSELSAIASAAQASMPDNSDKIMGGVSVPGSFRAGNSDTHYLGLGAGSSVLSSMKAHGVSVLGIYIDLSDLDPSEPESSFIPGSPHSATSYESFLKSIFSKERPQKPPLPLRQDMDSIINWYTRHSYAYLPVLHLPSLWQEVDRVYMDPHHQQTSAQTVILNMIIAIYYYQQACRLRCNASSERVAVEGIQRSHQYYHYALTFLEDLFQHRKVEDISGLALILQHMRGFPKPGGAWLLARLAMTMMVEMGMHRSAKKWLSENLCQDVIELELRKRLFHSILTMEVSLASKLGRPFSLRTTDYDTELPDRIDDEYLTAQGIVPKQSPTPGQEDMCKFDVAIEMFKIAAMYIDVVQVLYGIQRPSTERYVSIVQDFEEQLERWTLSFPKHLRLDPSGDFQLSTTTSEAQVDSKFQAAHLELWKNECRILIHHPSLGLSPSPSFNDSSLKTCVESSRRIIKLTDQMRTQADHLETTWYSTTVQFLAILTILFSLRRGDAVVDDEEVERVKQDMAQCADIMADVGRILGSGNNLSTLVLQLTAFTLREVEARKAGKMLPKSNGRSYSRGPYAAPTNQSGPLTAGMQKDPPQFQQQPEQGPYPPSTSSQGFLPGFMSEAPSNDYNQAPIGFPPQHNPPQPHHAPPPPPPQHTYPYNSTTDWARYSGDEDWRAYGAALGNIGDVDPGIATTLMNLSGNLGGHSNDDVQRTSMQPRVSPVSAPHIVSPIQAQVLTQQPIPLQHVVVSAPQEQTWTIQTNAYGFPEPVSNANTGSN